MSKRGNKLRLLRGKVELHLNGHHVGDVLVKGSESSWGYGEFRPNEHFSEFAPVFGRWSLLMHASDDEKHVPRDALQELRQAEYAIDSLRAKLYLPSEREWCDITQVNIDGSLIEWKEAWTSPTAKRR